MSDERRCPTCGGLVAADAEWCGQCFTPLRSSETAGACGGRRERTPGRRLRGRARRRDRDRGRPDRLDLPGLRDPQPDRGRRLHSCGTPFARLLEEPSAEPGTGPQTAAVWSMAFPGLGHWKLGRRGDALARFARFGWAFGALLVLLASRFGEGGLGPTIPLFLLFLGASVAIYVLSAVDAYRIAGASSRSSARGRCCGPRPGSSCCPC